MGMQINTNVGALNAYRNLSNTQNDLNKSLEKLSSGFRINRAGDDAAGLSISEGLRAQVGGLKVAARNAQDGISVVQTAEGALNEVHSILQRMRDLSVQAGNTGGLNDDALSAIKTEMDELALEVTRISDQTKFNGKSLLDGTFDGDFQVGANTGEAITVAIATDTDATGLGINALDVTAAGGSDTALTAIDAAIATVSGIRADLGAKQNRFEYAIKSINVTAENLAASESRIRDTDMAQEMSSFTRANILSQAGTAMLAQANQLPQGVLQLLG
ncbi:flagellin [Diaminobutyricimonas aerilata]|uniref:Flagellin n=1 Tax=Diaminobutyricimonas aerilata TaxID=1162967 RepID=A0A2M9CN18_9MICO|nr:flagellin [Diaminobutyricimonas aerilata]PJJ73297.1 flagellin [Diaminobutyricimonas aerilata]